ncbi:MAG: preprotein translocase subunit SecG [Defluviitaleaceae bacterium]|nr:preprotein translocase subunit SecG [Defluviitaleaceae bacterium]
MSPIYITLTAILGLVCVALVTVILMQKKRDAGFSGASNMSGGGEGPTHFEKNKGRTREGKLARMTKVLAAVFMVMSLVVGFLV